MNKNYWSLIIALAIIAVLAVSRLLPHWPNFTPVGAMALFGGCYLGKKYSALAVLGAMLLSDIVIGFHATMVFVYIGMLLYIFIGMGLRNRKTVLRTGMAAITGSVGFFLITNFGVWISFSYYPANLAGLLSSYVAAIPFFHYTLLGDLAYAAAAFGLYELLQRGLFLKSNLIPVSVSDRDAR